MVTKEEREAYEMGRREAKFAREYIYLSTSRPSDPAKAAAFDKGLHEQQLDEDEE